MKSTLLSAGALASDLGLLILRLVSGGALLTHGYPKLMKIVNGDMQFGDPVGLGAAPSLYLATLAEFVCTILVMLGLFTRLATIPLIINFLVAFLIVHSADPFQVKELSLMFLTVYLTIFFTGPGKYSIDASRK